MYEISQIKGCFRTANEKQNIALQLISNEF